MRGSATGVDEWSSAASPPARVAAPGEGISLDELRIAARNHGMPLEMLAHDVTPVGLHYLLVHYDIPILDRDAWRLEIDGHVERPLVLDMATLLAHPQTTRPVTLECAGNGRATLDQETGRLANVCLCPSARLPPEPMAYTEEQR
jgi:sulfane dehydrogenase subunit SoxC